MKTKQTNKTRKIATVGRMWKTWSRPSHSAVRTAKGATNCSKSGFCRQKRELPDDLALPSLGAQTKRMGSTFKQKLVQACVQ